MSRVKLTKLIGKLNGLETRFAPEVLYYSGNLSLMETRPRISVIGSRKASEDGLKRAAALTCKLVENQAVIVSGLAEGIDTIAHKSAISNYGKTIGVIGTPINQFYPQANQELQRSLMKDHLVLTQFPVSMPVKRHNFITRNRLMALISDATIIVEATDQSGTITQGWEAIRLKRPVFILESNFKNPEITWPHKMQTFGAYKVTRNNLGDLLKLLPKAALINQTVKADCFYNFNN